MRVITVVGARPQFVKAAVVSQYFKANPEVGIEETVIHTGQHFDDNMSGVFFDQLGMPAPKFNLGISSATHGAMTGRMLEGIEQILLQEKPDALLVYGDTNSTLAGALAAVKLGVPLAHVEAGLRSFNMSMPEEINRILTDRISNFLFCPTAVAVDNLRQEGLTESVFNVGDVMYDAALLFSEIAKSSSNIVERHNLIDPFVLVTCHRAENTNDIARLRKIVDALEAISSVTRVVFPIHPRTQKILEQQGWGSRLRDVLLLPPVSFLDMVQLERSASVILTDSGGVQKEAYFYGVPCVTMRDETEWVETVALGWNTMVGADTARIVSAVSNAKKPISTEAAPYGNGRASEAIAKLLTRTDLK